LTAMSEIDNQSCVPVLNQVFVHVGDAAWDQVLETVWDLAQDQVWTSVRDAVALQSSNQARDWLYIQNKHRMAQNK
jgi:hypothetical protein